MKPTTLEDCLRWLAERESDLRFVDDAVWVNEGALVGEPAMFCEHDNISAAIVEAVGDVWDQVHERS